MIEVRRYPVNETRFQMTRLTENITGVVQAGTAKRPSRRMTFSMTPPAQHDHLWPNTRFDEQSRAGCCHGMPDQVDANYTPLNAGARFSKNAAMPSR